MWTNKNSKTSIRWIKGLNKSALIDFESNHNLVNPIFFVFLLIFTSECFPFSIILSQQKETRAFKIFLCFENHDHECYYFSLQIVSGQRQSATKSLKFYLSHCNMSGQQISVSLFLPPLPLYNILH